MIGTISICKVFFLSALDQLNYAANSIDTGELNITDYGAFNSPALSGYEECFELLQESIRLYKEMVCEDVIVMRKMADTLEGVDLKLAHMWGAK